MLLPVEIWERIFIHIDPITLTKLRTTCKLWKEIIDRNIQDPDLWYKICKKDIPDNMWCQLLNSLYPSKSPIYYRNFRGDVEIWMNMYKWWSKSKNLIKYNTSIEYLDPIPAHRFQENITCIAMLENFLAIGTSEGYIYFYVIENLDKKLIYVADHMEFVCKVKFLKNDKMFIAVSCSINDHVKFWNLKSKEFVKKERGKLLCANPLYCYIAIGEVLVIQGYHYRRSYDIGGDIIAASADYNEVSLYSRTSSTDHSIIFGEVLYPAAMHFIPALSGAEIDPPQLVIRHYYMFHNTIAACITECGHLGLSINCEGWKFYNVLSILHGIPTAILIYTHLLILGLDSGHICIYYVEDFGTLDMTNTILTKRVILDTEPIISLDINVYLKQYIIAASSKRVHFINFI